MSKFERTFEAVVWRYRAGAGSADVAWNMHVEPGSALVRVAFELFWRDRLPHDTSRHSYALAAGVRHAGGLAVLTSIVSGRQVCSASAPGDRFELGATVADVLRLAVTMSTLAEEYSGTPELVARAVVTPATRMSSCQWATVSALCSASADPAAERAVA